ncbi:glycosyltransferase family A protein [Mangrovimonas aestuarii]|uniref:glycosyltransferase family A protein n=1 Tax=Mangrovimonas aestuarii TaxID=3018443 RepID=UPI0023784C2E|nr:glycosyltransferase family A protein [Mangrovimonas aestuarii]
MDNVENKSYTVEILISTMYRTSLSFLSKMFPNGNFSNYNILIVNQTTENKLLRSSFDNVRVINSFEKGLSLSRNVAIKNAKSNICLLADDDITYFDGFENLIVNAYEKHNSADIITFQLVNEKGELYSKYPNIVAHNKKTISTVNSVVVTFKREQVLKKNVFFNTFFGLGSVFETADEYIFLRNALQKGLNVFFEPKVLLKHPDFSSGKAVSSDKIVFARAAVFYKYNGELTYLKLGWHLFLLLKSGHLKLNQVARKYSVGLKGINKYKSLQRNKLKLSE